MNRLRIKAILVHPGTVRKENLAMKRRAFGFTRLVMLLAALTASSFLQSLLNADVLDWNPIDYAEGATTQSFGILGTDITFAFSGDLNFWSFDFPNDTTSITGGMSRDEESLQLQMDHPNNTDTLVLDVTFDTAVSGLSFLIFDIDTGPAGASFRDQVTVTGSLSGSPVSANLIKLGTSYNLSGNTATGISVASNFSSDGNLQVDFANQVDAFRIAYGNGPNAPPNPGPQGIALHDLSFTPTGDFGPPTSFISVDPQANYLRTADEGYLCNDHPSNWGPCPEDPSPGPGPAEIIELATAIPGFPIQAGDWITLQRVGEFRATQADCVWDDSCEGSPNIHPERPGTLRNLFGVFSGSDTLLPDPEALRGEKQDPIHPVDENYSRVPDAIAVLEGDAVPIETAPDPYRFGGIRRLQPTDIVEDFIIDIEGFLENATPRLVRVPEGATHLFVGAGDGQWFDNTLTTNPPYDDPVGQFGLIIEKIFERGDLTRDGLVDTHDIDLLNDAISGEAIGSRFDVNESGAVDSDDLTFFIHDVLGTWFGDSNLDGEFNSSDLINVFAAGKFENDQEALWSEGDWNGDGKFSTDDFIAAFSDGGYEMGVRATTAEVPEPSDLLMLTLGVLGMSRIRKR